MFCCFLSLFFDRSCFFSPKSFSLLSFLLFSLDCLLVLCQVDAGVSEYEIRMEVASLLRLQHRSDRSQQPVPPSITTNTTIRRKKRSAIEIVLSQVTLYSSVMMILVLVWVYRSTPVSRTVAHLPIFPSWAEIASLSPPATLSLPSPLFLSSYLIQYDPICSNLESDDRNRV